MAFASYKVKANLKLGTPGTNYAEVITTINLNNNTDDPESYQTIDGVTHFEEVVDDWSLSFTANWDNTGLVDFLEENDNDTVDFELEVLGTGTTVLRTYVGEVLVKAPGWGGDAGTRATFELELACAGKPTVTS